MAKQAKPIIQSPSTQAKRKVSPKDIMQGGKKLKETVDSKVTVLWVDYAALYLGSVLYSSAVSPLVSICRLMANGAVLSDRPRIMKAVSIIIVASTAPLTVFSLLQGKLTGVAYPLGGIVAWYYLWLKLSANTTDDIDAVLRECREMESEDESRFGSDSDEDLEDDSYI